MNYLAHIYLSCDHENLMLGNFMADFLTNKQVGTLKPEIQLGIKLHRLIDSYTDKHHLVKQGIRRLRPNQGKYAPVAIDILYDYVLARNWDHYHQKSLQVFANEVYDILNANILLMPPKLQSMIPRMIMDRFIEKYATKDGLRFALRMMDRRTKFPSNFESAAEQLFQDWEVFNEEFNGFFPEVKEESIKFIKEAYPSK